MRADSCLFGQRDEVILSQHWRYGQKAEHVLERRE